MKNLILITIIGLFFSCGNEDKSNAKTANINTETAKKTTETVEKSIAESSDLKTVTEEITPESKTVESKTEDKNVVETKTISEKKQQAKKEIPISKTTTPKVETPVVIEQPKVEMTDVDKMKMEEEKKRTEALKQKEAEARRKGELEKKKQMEEEAAKKKASAETKFNHNVFNVLLQKHVSATGKVNYNNFKKDEAKLDAYLAKAEALPFSKSWPRNKQLAFWINVYNAYTIKLILKNHPVKSITDLHGGKPWDVKWINIDGSAFGLGKTLSLNNIENDIIRPAFKEPRIHFAVNCAAKSCPPLYNKAWTAAALEKYFERQTKAFVNNSTYNSISGNSAEVSKIFEWYGEDFGSLIDFLNKYSNTKIAAGTKIKFKEYNWKLNN